ncbi:hypothetical protein BGX31_010699 [Mortierella sp. GBA43]|nr:hypothetical protein BGX31_010699 [Mortierella sp. GBA43]
MPKDSREPHEVHMTSHPGYDLTRPKEFFDKYGSYVLTMMYMVKYGAMAAGFVVPPLLQSKHTGMFEQSQEQQCPINENIGQLIDDTIAYLEGMAITIDSGANIQRWSLVRADLADVNVTKRLYDVTAEICTIQCMKDKLPLNMDCGRLLLMTNGSRNVQEAAVTIKRLSDLTTDDIEFIRQLNLAKLLIEYTPKETDEDRLVNILQQSLNHNTWNGFDGSCDQAVAALNFFEARLSQLGKMTPFLERLGQD